MINRFCDSCGGIYSTKYCERCYKPRKHKLTTAERGYDKAWRKLSEFKRRVDPLCERCMQNDKTTPASEVHHKIPIYQAPHLRLQLGNLMSVCRPCHEVLDKECEERYGKTNQ